MQNFNGKTAFITGGGSGIGLALAHALGQRGMNVMLADVQIDALKAASDSLRADGVKVDYCVCDVSRREAVEAAAQATVAAFGKVHLVCNNAGVSVTGPIGQIDARDWNWILGVNLMGVVHGVEVFTPLIQTHGEGGHFLQTASMGGMIAAPTHEPYVGTKFAVVGMSEAWAQQLAPLGIGMTILCPAFVKTRIAESRRNQPGFVKANIGDDGTSAAVQAGISPTLVAEASVTAIEDNQLYLLTHPEFRTSLRLRFEAIAASFVGPGAG